ncbi:amidohydrolase family protein [Flagellimonas myxillae]|uniref:amidohydrolase family protein n=1 Tax=Flagellimonas myxillae TaxID=2942214 RepID=UPI00201EB365|nr:amidohydrolase family protein [Muricauda myxillae]MCL6265352.1 amidohydrolase family protein [Muricauda myxillae]
MKKLFFLFLITSIILSCESKRDISGYDFIIQNVKLFDGESFYENATVLVDSNKIKEIIKTNITEFEGENIIDGKGFTLTPGFINAHVHAFNKEHTKEAVQSGVLTLLGLFSTQPKRSDSLKILGNTSKEHAYFYFAGPTVTVQGGHGSQFGPVPLIKDVEDIPKFISDRIDEGSDFIKLIIERGDSTYKIPTLTDEMIKKAIEETKKNNIVSIAHITWRSDAIKAASYGIDGFAHLWSRDSSEITQQDLKLLKESKIFIVPTVLAWKKADESNWRKVNIDLMKQELLRVYRAGIPILAGTDPPNHNINYGSDLFKELELFVESGISEIDALRSATSNISRAFNLKDKGFVKEGFPADLVLIEGDPTTNIKNVYSIVRVWKNGNEIALKGKD